MDKHRTEAHAKTDAQLAEFLRKHLAGAPFSEWTQSGPSLHGRGRPSATGAGERGQATASTDRTGVQQT